MLSGESNGKKIGLICQKKKKQLCMSGSTLCSTFAIVLHDYKVKLSETFWLHVL